jgi:pyruvate kinase
MHEQKTRIVCSMGPASSDDAVVRDLILAGMNVARFNFSHGTHEEHREQAECVWRVSKELGVPVALLLDTKGPEIRTGMVKDDGKVTINKGDAIDVSTDGCFTQAPGKTGRGRLSVSWKDAARKLTEGHRILIADGLLELEVLGVDGEVIRCRANNTAVIGSRKNVNLIGIHAGLPIMSGQDKKDILFGVEMGFDFIAASFLSYAREITEIKKYIDSLAAAGAAGDEPSAALSGKKANFGIKVIAKIESGEGLENIKEIARLADGVMVARGDLGVQLPAERIPLAQKHIIEICRRAGKPVITATQMLDSMIVNPRPTRAELTDVANAIFDGTDAVMLSGETANGAYPVEAVKTMAKIALTVEQSPEFRRRMSAFHNECHADAHNASENVSLIMSRSGVETAAAIQAKAIVTPTLTGNTARVLSAFRPDQPILAVTPDEHAERAMLLYWGVIPWHTERVSESGSMVENAIKAAAGTGAAAISDKIVLVAGLPLHSPHSVNTVRVIIIGSILARASSGGCGGQPRVTGRVIHAATPHEARDLIGMLGGEILVCRVLTDDYTPIIRIVNGVICESVSEVSEERLLQINPRLVWLTHIRRATQKFESGLTVTLDAKQLLVYEGSV